MPSVATDATPGATWLGDGPQGAAQLFIAQFFFLTALGIPLVTVMVVGTPTSAVLFDAAVALAGLTAVLSGVLTWRGPWARGALILPLLDLVVCFLLYVATPNAGFSVLLVLPVAWIANFHPLPVARLVTVVTILAVLAVPFVRILTGTEPQDAGLPGIANTTILLALAAVAAQVRNRRHRAQRVLLRRQTQMLASALKRAHVQEEVLSEVLDAVDFAVMTVGPDGSVERYNRATDAIARHFGAGHLTDLSAIPLYAADKVTPIPTRRGRLAWAAGGSATGHDILWLGRPDEEQMALSVSVRHLTDDGGTGRSVLIARDVTPELAETAARDDLVTSVSHEIRTPLSSILGYLELVLEQPDLDAESREMLEVALDNTERLMRLSKDFLSARSSSPTHSMTLEPEPCRPAEVVEKAIEALRPLALERLISLVPGPLHDGQILADPLRLRQVVDNLLTNAVKYNRYGGRVQVDVLADGLGVLIQVSDTGRGMSEQDLKRLFTRFYRTDAARASGVAGSGIGLNITREIVELHHGTIDVTSTAGEGTTVTVRLPAVPPTATEDPA